MPDALLSVCRAAGVPSAEQRRKVITNQIWDLMGGCAPAVCSCKCCGRSSSDCKCDVPGLGPDHKSTARCGYPFTFGDGNGFISTRTKRVVHDPYGCKGELNKTCFDGVFI